MIKKKPLNGSFGFGFAILFLFNIRYSSFVPTINIMSSIINHWVQIEYI